MSKFTFAQTLLFVSNLQRSLIFYNEILGLTPAFESPTYAMFVLTGGIKLGLWFFEDAQLQNMPPAGSSEICFLVENVDEVYTNLKEKNVLFAQEPIDLDFGKSFVFLDPDNHRIRVYKLQR